MIESGNAVLHETLLWDAGVKATRVMRRKEDAHDYRYFPEPDLVPVVITDAMLDDIRAALPELAVARRRRFVEQYGLPAYDAGVLTESRSLGDYFESIANTLKEKSVDRYKTASNIVMTEVMRILTEQRIDVAAFSIDAARLAELVELFASDTISSKNVKDIFAEMLISQKSAGEISAEKGFVQISDTGFLESAIEQVLAGNTSQLEDYRAGKTNLFGYFVGETMKLTKGQANPKMVADMLRQKL
ncbi:MAG: hypothetical protein H7X80_11805 [bacterium]|nr:hypothetical protein [Candidatus Kapabacteria bacterium]